MSVFHEYRSFPQTELVSFSVWNGLAFESILIDDKQMEQLTSR
jgi:hypothetical protein